MINNSFITAKISELEVRSMIKTKNELQNYGIKSEESP